MLDNYPPDRHGQRNYRLHHVLLLLSVGLLSGIQALAQPFICRQFSANDGLPSSYCFAPIQDADGYLWVGTYGGVGRFDGTTFKTFTVNSGLVNNQATSLFEDRQHNIWIGTFNGISIWQQGRFRTITTVGKLPIERVFGITQTKDGRILVASSQGLLSFETPNATPTLYNRDISNNPVDHLWAVCETASGELLVSNTYHLYRFTKNRFEEIKYTTGKPVEARPIVQLGNRILIGTFEQGMAEYKSGAVSPIYTDVLAPDLRVFQILTDQQKRLWLATNQGAICMYNNQVVSILSVKNQLPSDKCLGMCLDAEGNIWLTTPEGLIQCRDRFIDMFTKADGLLNDEIYSLAKDKNGTVYFGGSNGPFTAYSNGRFFQPFPAFTGTQVSDMPIHFVKFDQHSNAWVSCDADSVFKITTGHIEKIKPIGKFCTAFLEDWQRNIIWVGSRAILFRYQQGQWEAIQAPPKMGIDDILALHQDRQQRLWVGTYGLRIFDGQTWTDLSKQTNTEKVFIQAIKTDAEGSIWLGTIGKGIRKIRVDQQGRIVSVETITTREGLQNDSVLDLEFDNDGQLWVGSFGGVMRVDLKRPKEQGQYHSQLFNRYSGVLDNAWQMVSLLKDNDGNMWVGTPKGAMRFTIRRIPTSSPPPPAHISSAQLLPNANEPASSSQNLITNAVLPYNHNTLNFQFTGISLSDPTGIRYSYKLDGVPEATWSAFSNQRSVNFSNLSPNTYTLRLKALNANGIESQQEARFTFTIKPPFWQTWWFRGLLAILTASAILAVVQFRIRFLNEKHKAALQLSEWKLKALQSQMNPHFLFNSLNSIQNYIISNKPIEGVKYLSKFSRLIRRILENSNHQLMKLEQIIETLQMYVELEAMRFNHEFSYEFITDDEDILYDILLPPMLFQPFVENAIWHGLMPKQGEKKLVIQVEKQDNNLLCIIEDNGVGRKNSQKPEGHTSRGESITRHTFEAFNQQMGKEATLTVIDKTEPQTGTRVEIRVPL